MGKRKHFDLIVAWAEGAEVEYKSGSRWLSFSGEGFTWHPDHEYRIKRIPEQQAVVDAFEAGEAIEVSLSGYHDWDRLVGSPSWDFTRYDYRVEPEPVNRFADLAAGATRSRIDVLNRMSRCGRLNRVEAETMIRWFLDYVDFDIAELDLNALVGVE